MKKIYKLTATFLLTISAGMFSANCLTDTPTNPPENKIKNSFEVKTTEINLTNPHTNEPLKLVIWYPYDKEETCTEARLCLANNIKLGQAVMISHGAKGSARDLNWIGYATASQGIVTVGVNHYGESWSYGRESQQAGRVLELWRRPAEVSAALDVLANNKANGKNVFNKQVNWDNSTIIGFSAGGTTAMILIGAKMDFLQFSNYCHSEASKDDVGCTYLKENTMPEIPKDAFSSLTDSRIKRAIALDPGVGIAATKSSLESISTPVLIVGAKNNDFLPFNHHAGLFHKHVKSSELVTLTGDEGHFVFIDECNHQFKAQGISLCEDKDGVDRKAVHNRLYPEIFRFIYTHQ